MNEEIKDNSKIVEVESSYKIFNYMERHHSLLIASISAIVAVGSLILSVLIYVYQCIVLQSWNVPMELVGEVKKDKFFYIAFLGILYYFCVPIYQMCMQKIVKRYYCYFPLTKIQKKISKKLSRLANSKEKDWKEALKELKKSISGIKRQAMKEVIGATFCASVLLAFFMLLFQISLGNIKGLYLVAVGSVLLIVLLMLIFFSTKHTMDRSKLNEFKKRSQSIARRNEAIELLHDVNDYQKQMSSAKYAKKTIKESFCDRNISTFVVLMIGTFACLCIFFLLSGFMTAKMQKAFWIYEKEVGKSYVVIYQNEEKAIMKEADFRDDTIVINLDKQLITKIEGNQFEYIEFERVQRIEVKK